MNLAAFGHLNREADCRIPIWTGTMSASPQAMHSNHCAVRGRSAVTSRSTA
jgi:hypothetical protein